MRIRDEIERAAKELPDGYVLSLNVEQGAAWISLAKNGAEINVNDVEGSLAGQIHGVVTTAIAMKT